MLDWLPVTRSLAHSEKVACLSFQAWCRLSLPILVRSALFGAPVAPIYRIAVDEALRQKNPTIKRHSHSARRAPLVPPIRASEAANSRISVTASMSSVLASRLAMVEIGRDTQIRGNSLPITFRHCKILGAIPPQSDYITGGTHTRVHTDREIRVCF